MFEDQMYVPKEQEGCPQPTSPSAGHHAEKAPNLSFLCMMQSSRIINTTVPSKQEKKLLTHWVKRMPLKMNKPTSQRILSSLAYAPLMISGCLCVADHVLPSI